MGKRFVKMHGLGNDFIFFDGLTETFDIAPNQVIQLCDRHFGIGADGVIVVKPSSLPDCVAFMHYINSDGTLAQMCGNGVRCFAKYLVDYELVDSHTHNQTFSIETRAGVRKVAYTLDSQGKLLQATVDMGIPETIDENLRLDSPWGFFSFIAVSMGNPHAVHFVSDWSKLPDEAFVDPRRKSLETFDVAKVGAYFESHPAFPEKTNVEFVSVEPSHGSGVFSMRVYERGCGETLACGTGACAVAQAAIIAGLADDATKIQLSGGTLHITKKETGHILMTGAAAISFIGTVEMPNSAQPKEIL